MKWLLIFFAAVIALAIFAGGKKPENANAEASDGKTSAAPAAPPVAVTASALFSAYEENEVAADQKYKNKVLLVSGTVQSIDKDFTDRIVVKLAASNPYMPVHAYLGSQHEELAASLKKGSKVAWQCTGEGRIVGSPMLKDCAPKS
ncbi:OB-fold putative lipoprotein [Ralstonia pseudosolanacearum]